MHVYQIREEKCFRILAVKHPDGSGRIQTVKKSHDLRYYQLIELFYPLNNMSILLNTSFNENEPVVCTPEEALDCFLRNEMAVLVLGNWFTRRGA